MFQAVNTGHEGSLSTIHANDARDRPLETRDHGRHDGLHFPLLALRHYYRLGHSLDCSKLAAQGSLRKVTRISEVVGLENGEYVLV